MSHVSTACEARPSCFEAKSVNEARVDLFLRANVRPTVLRRGCTAGGREPQQEILWRRVKSKRERKQRVSITGRSTVYLQVVGVREQRTVLRHCTSFPEYNRYLFNCGEGTQRLMHEHKLKASHLDNIFLTRLSWMNVGGLSGMILTLKDIGVPECVLSGPPQLESYLDAIRIFSGPLEDIKLSVRPYTAEPYTDETMTVYQVPIFAQSRGDGRNVSPKSDRSQSQSPPSPRKDDSKSHGDRPGSPGKKGNATTNISPLVSFICKIHPKKGNFLVPQAVELGLPVGTAAIGPLIAALKGGKSITYNGKEIQPEQVCTPSEPGAVFIIVECPSEEFIEAVCTNQQLKSYQTGGTEGKVVLVAHMTPDSVLKTDQYKKWMERFPSTTEHLILNEHVRSVHNVRSHKIQTQLNMIHPEIFPQFRPYEVKEPQAALPVPCVKAECLLKFQLRPVMEWQRDAIPSCNTEEFVKEASEVPNFLEEVDECKKICFTDAAETSGEREKYPEVVFMGTGSAVPMKIRNVSGTLVNISPSQSILLDCGEGTFGQLCRHYGDNVDQVLSKISTVFISHMHADHHTGLLMLLYQRERALTALGKPFSPVFLMAPNQIMIWLSRYHNDCEEILDHINFISNHSLCEGKDNTTQNKTDNTEMLKTLLKNNDLEKFQTCLVHHCRNAFACSFTHHSGWKLAFSGDTMPCEAFVRIGKNATLLIHEATLEDGLEEEAKEKRHREEVRWKIRLSIYEPHSFRSHMTLFSIFLCAQIRFGDFKIIPRLIPTLQTLFATEIGEMEEKREKREREQKHLRGDFSELDSEPRTTDAGRVAKRDQEEASTHQVETKRLKTI
ncbi:zinc phosphodiesterase ELAC protein 2 [Morone saxatilis]|uniref:zinc phosphodiesterase ELAC protein 2 n=1 Tax=Morone saxatilis TaxID=34816 RepID=UPI0015E257A3|nr:zinc phosphodiesterase ELAC protein 2 [Morone saxatilis]